VLYLVLFDTFLKSESVTLYSSAAKYQMLAKKSKLRYQKELEKFTSEENQWVKDSEPKTMSESEMNEREAFTHW
jgi:hypothetical protein